jgi:hypothetical protein
MRVWLLLLVVGVALSQIPDCHLPQPGNVKPDLRFRCNKLDSCAYCNKIQMSFEWLCCEDDTGWVSAHILTPFLIYMFWQSPVWSAFIPFLFEPLENLWVMFVNNAASNQFALETFFGSAVGDALINGLTGLWLGTLITYIFDLPMLSSTQYRAHQLNAQKRRWRYVIVWGIHIACIFFIPLTNDGDTIRYGVYINCACQALFFWILYPWVLYTDRENALVWSEVSTDRNSPVYPKWKRYTFFYSAGAMLIGLELSNGGWQYLANDWFQVWVTAWGCLTVLTILACIIAWNREDKYMFVIWIAAYLIGISVAFVIIQQAYLINAWGWTALATAIAAALMILANEQWQSRARPYNVNYSYREEPMSPLKTHGPRVPLKEYMKFQ